MHNPYLNSLQEYKKDLAIKYIPAVKSIAYKLKERLPSNIEFNDLVSIGLEELVKLSKTYDPSKNIDFWGYAKKRVYGSMIDFLRSLDIVSRNNRKLLKQLEKIIDNYYTLYGEEPDNKYIADKLNISEEEVKKLRNTLEITYLMPLNEQLNSINNIEKNIEKEQLIELIKKVLKNFSKTDQLVIQLYYFEELTFKEIAEILNITESRVSQIHKKIIRKLREVIENG